MGPNKKVIFNLRVYAQKLGLFATRDDGKYPYNEWLQNEKFLTVEQLVFLEATYQELFPSWRVSFRLQDWSGFQKVLARHPAEGSIARPWRC